MRKRLPSLPEAVAANHIAKGGEVYRVFLQKLSDADTVSGAFSGKVDTGFPQKMRPTQEARARFRFHQIETRSSAARADRARPRRRTAAGSWANLKAPAPAGSAAGKAIARLAHWAGPPPPAPGR